MTKAAMPNVALAARMRPEAARERTGAMFVSELRRVTVAPLLTIVVTTNVATVVIEHLPATRLEQARPLILGYLCQQLRVRAAAFTLLNDEVRQAGVGG
jgi:hypothetical protein